MQLEHDLIDPIVQAVTAGKPVKRIWLFGSRATGHAGAASDIDLAVEAEQWTDTDVNLAHDRLEETVRTPLKFDLVDIKAVKKPALKRAILDLGRVIYES